ncbi:MAG: FtsQ-type POTRA domain-containing protein [Candidatus Moranbacteria bacterium]|nr:FtsQ-type POTRA domain-containing protein [Candidatus Moranbacteria bacterium]
MFGNRRKRLKKNFKRKRKNQNKNGLIGIKNDDLRQNLVKLKLVSVSFFLSIILFFFLLIYLFFFSSLFKVQEIVVKGNQRNNSEVIISQIEPYLEGNFLKIFSQSHFLALNTKEIEKMLLENFKSIEEVEIKKKLFGKLEVNIVEKQIKAAMCSQSECIIIDDKGVVLKRFPKDKLYEYGENIELIVDQSNTLAQVGEGVNTKDYVEFIDGLRYDLNANGIMVREVITPLPSASEIQVVTIQDYVIIFDSSLDFSNQLESLKLILEKEIPKEKIDCLEYIDLRIKNKVYYRYYDDCKKEQDGKIKEETGESAQEGSDAENNAGEEKED